MGISQAVNEFGFGLFAESWGDDLLSAILEKRYSRAYSLLRKREEPLEKAEAARCLEGALNGTPRLFARVLEACAPGEYSGDVELTDQETGCGYTVSGTMLTLAAALDQVEHMKLLLEHGYDVNAAGLESVQAGLNSNEFCTLSDAPRGSSCCATRDNRVICHKKAGKGLLEEGCWTVSCSTPLAAAIACGSMDAVAFLLKQPGVWTRESTGVCRAAVAVMEGNWRQRDCVFQVFPTGKHDPLFSEAECVLEEWRFPPAAVSDLCTGKQLDRMLKSGLYSEEDGREILRGIGRSLYYDRGKQIESKLLVLARAFPQMCREPWAAGIFLRTYFYLEDAKTPHKRLLACWKRLSGKVGDLTLGLGCEEEWRRPLGLSDLRRILPELEKDMELVADADALCGPWSTGELQFIARHVRLYRTPGLKGVSGFAGRILGNGDIRLLSGAAKRGALAGESKTAMLDFIRSHECNPSLRHVILSMEQGEKAPEVLPEDWMKDPKWKFCKWWDNERDWKEPEEGFRWFSRLWTERLTGEETARMYAWARTTANMRSILSLPQEYLIHHPILGTLEGDDLLSAAACGENPELLRVLLEEEPCDRYKVVEIQMNSPSAYRCIRGTLLTAAAATGRTEQVRLLLERGGDPNETGTGNYSALYGHSFHGDPKVAVTPALAALLMGEEGTLRMLLQAGAKLNLTVPHVFNALVQAEARGLELAARMPGIGYDKLSEAQRSTLRQVCEARRDNEDQEYPF